MKIQGLYLTWIVVKDIEAAVKFYTEVVGLTLKEFHKEFGWAELSGPDGTLLGIAQETPQEVTKAGSNGVITIAVDDIVSARNELAKKGVLLIGDVIEVPGHVKMQTFTDKDGNMLQIVQTLS